MKKWRFLTILLFCFVLIGAISCESLTGEEDKGDQFTEVVRDDLIITVSGTGNIAASDDRQLSFGTGGKIERILVEEGDTVSEGEVLAELETDALELAVKQGQVALAQAELALAEAQFTVTQARVAVAQAQFNIDSAEYDLVYTEELYLWTEISAAQGEVADAVDFLKNALNKLALAPPGTDSEEDWQKTVFYAEKRLKTARNRLDAMLAGTDTEQLALKRRQIGLSEQTLEQARQSEELARQSKELARQSEELARQTLSQAEKQLVEAVLTAPFSGIITDVNAEENDTVTPAVPVFRLIDNERMELNVDVDEVDIAYVIEGQDVIIELDALPEITVKGKVGYIHELPRKEGGVVLYRVRIEFNVPANSGIRNGMSANADIILEKRSGVLLVPNRAIRQNSQGESIVEISLDEEKEETEERIVVTGISDGYLTEITSGLSEGETVVERRR